MEACGRFRGAVILVHDHSISHQTIPFLDLAPTTRSEFGEERGHYLDGRIENTRI